VEASVNRMHDIVRAEYGGAFGPDMHAGTVQRASQSSFLAIFLVTAIAVAAMGASIFTGYQSGFHQRLSPHNIGRYLFAISVALTDRVYGLDGYVFYEPVETALKEGGLTDQAALLEKLAVTYPDNLTNPALIDAAIMRASQLDLKIPLPQLQTPKYGVRGSPGDDVGLADFVKLSFGMFGNTMESLYWMQVLLYVAAAFLFWMAFRDSAEKLVLLACFCTVHAILLMSPLFPGDPQLYRMELGWMTSVEPRVLTTLGLIPFIHFIASILQRTALNPRQILCLVGQAFILFFVVKIRASAVWILIAVFVMTFAVALLRKRTSHTRPPAQSIGQSWVPFGLLGAVFVIGYIHMATQLHPLYKGGGYIPYHALCHEAYYSLQFNPDWVAKFGSTHAIKGQPATGDEQPVAGFLHYLSQHPPKDPNFIYDQTGSYKWAAIEKYLCKAFWEFIWENPLFTFETFFISKYQLLTVAVGDVLRALLSGFKLLQWSVLLGVTVVFAGIFARLDLQRWRQHRNLILTLVLCVSATMLPNFVALMYWHVMADAIFFTGFVTVLVASLALASVGRALIRLSGKKSRHPA
jgi:hypothetical protein